MYFDSNGITVNVDDLNKRRDELQAQMSHYKANESNIVQQYDREKRRLNTMKCNMDAITDSMYLIDPSQDNPSLRTPDYKGPCASGRINPNHRNNFLPCEEEFTFEPGSETHITKKSILEQQRQIRIYPHMYNNEEALRKGEEKQAKIREQPSCGGVDYPIPMYFKLQSLQEPARRVGENLDYDIRLKTCRTGLPKSVLTSEPNAAIINGEFQTNLTGQTANTALQQQRLKQTVNSNAETCGPIIRQRAQEEAVRSQQRIWYGNGSERVDTIVGNGCKSKYSTQRITPQTMTEKNTFEQDVNMTPLRQPKYPREEDMKSSFFGLGPAIPPPNPLLLSTIPSSITMHDQAINSTNNQSRLDASEAANPSTVENFENNFFDVATSVFTKKIGSFGYGNAMSAPPQYPNKPLPTPTNTTVIPVGPGTNNTTTTEFQTARSPEELALKQTIQLSIDQQRQALMQISDLRHSIAGLKQRVVENRAWNDAQGTTTATQQIEDAMDAISKLREIIHTIQRRRAEALERLAVMLTAQEFGYLKSVVANQIKLVEVQIKQYHEQPADNAVVAFRSSHFGCNFLSNNPKSDGYIMQIGFYDAPTTGGIGAKQLKSLKIGKDVTVKLYERPGRQGKVITYIGPRRVPLLPLMWDNTVSGIEILSKSGPLIDCWDAPFYQGGHVRLPEGKFDYPDVGGIQSGKLSSLSIPDGLEVTFYSRPQFAGEKITFIGPQKLSFLPSDWNSKVFGMVVSKRFPGQ